MISSKILCIINWLSNPMLLILKYQTLVDYSLKEKEDCRCWQKDT